jgi:PAS domain S-box-containing protein
MTQDIRTVEGQTLKGGGEYSEKYLSQLEDFFVNAPVGAMIVDANERVVRANATVLEMVGLPGEDRLRGRPVFDLFDGDLRARVAGALSPPGELVNNVRGVVRSSNGRTEPVLVDCNARFGESGTVYSRWFVRPVEARVLPSAEREVDRPLDGLSEDAKRERFRLLNDFFENAPVGVHFVGLNGLILRSNQREKELLGYGAVPAEYDGIHVSKIHWDKKKIELLLSRLAESVPVIDEKAFMLKKEGEIFVARIYSGLRLKGGAFENTRCFLFADANQSQQPVEMQEYTFPRFDDFGDA